MSARQTLRLSVLVLTVLAITLSLQATSMGQADYKCPICGVALQASVIVSTNNFGGYDRDFLEYAVGSQPLLFEPITCTHCFYSGYSSDFGQEVKGIEALKKAILTDKQLKPMKPIETGTPSDDVDAWVKYDLIAQTQALSGDKEDTLANTYLLASWAIRLTSYPLKTLDKKQKKDLDKWMEKTWEKAVKAKKVGNNKAEVELDHARAYERMAMDPECKDRLMAAYAAVAIYRSHGESSAAMRVLGLMKSSAPSETCDAMIHDVESTTVAERYFQRKALAHFEKAAPPEKKCTQERQTYLCGELSRRLEDYPKARQYFEQVKEFCKDNSYLKEWVAQQLELCGSGA